MAKYYTVVTEKGIEKLNTSIQTNKSFSATKMAVGDSNGSYYEPEKTQTELKNQKYIANCYAKGKRDNYLYFDLQLPPSVGDFYIREVGLFDNDLNLLAVAKYPETLKTSANGSLEKTLNIEIRIELSKEALKQVVIDEAGNLARIEEVNDLLALKQDIIPDLTEIKKGASLGGTALQSFTETDPVYTADKATLALKTEIPTKLSELTNDSKFVNETTFNTTLLEKLNASANNLTASGKSTVANLAMPSNKYDSLSIGSSGTTYTAPANGWFCFRMYCASLGFVGLFYPETDPATEAWFATSFWSTKSQSNVACYLPAKKGQQVLIAYSDASVKSGSSFLNFVYAEGDATEEGEE